MLKLNDHDGSNTDPLIVPPIRPFVQSVNQKSIGLGQINGFDKKKEEMTSAIYTKYAEYFASIAFIDAKRNSQCEIYKFGTCDKTNEMRMNAFLFQDL